MFTIKTRVGPSAIHGIGVFADEEVAEGAVIWRFLPPFDRIIEQRDLDTAPAAVMHHLGIYAYHSADLGGRLVLSGDHARFLNHQDEPNTREAHLMSIASRAIARGDEITCDYRAFCTDWQGFDDEPVVLPHENVLARLGRSDNGVGVFALVDIPARTPLFSGDPAHVVRVPVDLVKGLSNDDIRKLYVDFCPVRGGCYVAPRSFDQLTIGWYLNHSDQPNVIADERLRFRTARAVKNGEELTADYTTYSDHASAFTRGWAK